MNNIRNLAAVFLLQCSINFAMASTWTAAGTNQNWTLAANWSTYPIGSSPVYFDNTSFFAGTNAPCRYTLDYLSACSGVKVVVGVPFPRQSQ